MTKKKIIQGTGSEYSSISNEVEMIFKSWLEASGLTKEECFAIIDGEDFYPYYEQDENNEYISLNNDDGEIGAPFIWKSDYGIKRRDYKIDAAMVLVYIASNCENPATKQKLKEFVKEELLKGM